MLPTRAATTAALLDFDLTLVDSVPAILEATNRFADDVGRPRIDRETLMASIGLPLEDTWANFWGGWEPDWPILYRDRYKDLEMAGFRLFGDTAGTLSVLKGAGIKIAVVTNRWMASLACERAGVARWLDAVVGAEEVVRAKPDPEPALKALELLGAKPCEAVYVVDTPIDMMTAVGAGVCPVGVTTGPADRAELEAAGARWVIDRLWDLLPLLGLTRNF